MSLTIYHHSGEQIKRFSWTVRRVLLLSSLALFVAIGTGFWIGHYYANTAEQKNLQLQQSLSQWKVQTKLEQKQLSEIKNKTVTELESLGIRLSLLQSHIARLDALGARLVESLKLDEEEFNFSHSPAIGGGEDDNEIKEEEGEPLSSSGVEHEINRLEKLISTKQQKLALLESLVIKKQAGEAQYISGRPVNRGWVSSFYGVRNDPIDGHRAMHKGFDFAGNEGDEIVATAAGIVTYAGERYGYGLLVEVQHGDGYSTRYAHNKKIVVKVGEVVEKGQAISVMGSTGRSTGPHVHYEVLKNGRAIDPKRYVNRKAKKYRG